MYILFLASGCLFYNVQIYDEIKKGDAIAITGCDSGLGYSIALHCKNNLGLHVIAGVHSTTSRGAQELVKNGIEIIEIELTNLESVESFTKSIQKLLESQKYRKYIYYSDSCCHCLDFFSLKIFGDLSTMLG